MHARRGGILYVCFNLPYQRCRVLTRCCIAVKFGLGKHQLATDPTQGYKILMVRQRAMICIRPC